VSLKVIQCRSKGQLNLLTSANLFSLTLTKYATVWCMSLPVEASQSSPSTRGIFISNKILEPTCSHLMFSAPQSYIAFPISILDKKLKQCDNTYILSLCLHILKMGLFSTAINRLAVHIFNYCIIAHIMLLGRLQNIFVQTPIIWLL